MTLPNPDRLAKAIFFIIAWLFVFISVEVTAQILYRIRYGQFVWQEVTKRFTVKSFTRLATDSRHVTIIPNFSDPKYFGFGISTDAYGFRRGAQTTKPDCPNVVFIGDSVPFGWGVPDQDSIPSKLFELLRNANDPRCVVNAAIPSYSLFQAVARFEYEIMGKFKIDSVYLQIYDPVRQFVRFGAKWRPDMDFTTEPAGALIKQKPEYIASIAVARNALVQFGVLARYNYYYENFNSADKHSLDGYRLEIRRKLEHLHDLTVQADVKQLIVAPVTVPSGAYQQLREEDRIAIEAINDQLRQFAKRHEDTTFLDTIGLLKSYPDVDMFLDECCHMTERGNDLVAGELTKILIRK